MVKSNVNKGAVLFIIGTILLAAGFILPSTCAALVGFCIGIVGIFNDPIGLDVFEDE